MENWLGLGTEKEGGRKKGIEGFVLRKLENKWYKGGRKKSLSNKYSVAVEDKINEINTRVDH